jgi:hypothetical protein
MAKKKSAPKVADKDVCFVIMPFGGWLDSYYQDIYFPAIKAAGLDPHRADDLFRPSTIVNDIWAYTKRARLVLADLSGKNPNVFYELGLAHALAKPAILVAASMDDVPFDLRALRVLVYDKNAPNWGDDLGQKIKSAIKEVLRVPAEAVLPAFLDTKGSGPKPTLTPEQKEVLELRQQIDLLRRQFLESPSRMQGEALTKIHAWVAEGLDDKVIIRRARELGWGANWTAQELTRVRSQKKHERDQPSSGEHFE